MLKIVVNPDAQQVEKIRQSIKDNDGYCPCQLVKTPETKCICMSFLEQEQPSWCHCGLYYKEVIE